MIALRKLDIVEVTMKDRVIHLTEDELRRFREEIDRYFGQSLQDQVKSQSPILPSVWIDCTEPEVSPI